MKNKFYLIVFVLLTGFYSFGQKIENTEALFKAMQLRYKENTPANITFLQKTSFYRNDSLVNTAYWYEALSLPKKLRIDFGEIKNGNGLLFINDSLYNFRKGNLVGKRPYKHNVLLLAHDIYFLSPVEIINSLENDKYNLRIFRQDIYNGHEVYVVGAKEGDTASNQFWIDKKLLHVLRVIEKGIDGSKEETILSGHQIINKGWIETKVESFRDGKLIQAEEYSQINADVVFPENLFNPAYFAKISWVKKE